MFICRIRNRVDIIRHYRFPYRLVKELIHIDLGFVESQARRPVHRAITAGTEGKHGEEIFAQARKLDHMGARFITGSRHVGKIDVRDDELIIAINCTTMSGYLQEWKRIEQIIEDIFCLPIRNARK